MAIFNEGHWRRIASPGKEVKRRDSAEEEGEESGVRQGRNCVISMQRSLDRGSKLRRGRRRRRGSLHRTWHRGRQTNANNQTVQESRTRRRWLREKQNNTRWRGQDLKFLHKSPSTTKREAGRQRSEENQGGGGPKKTDIDAARCNAEPENERSPANSARGPSQSVVGMAEHAAIIDGGVARRMAAGAHVGGVGRRRRRRQRVVGASGVGAGWPVGGSGRHRRAVVAVRGEGVRVVAADGRVRSSKGCW